MVVSYTFSSLRCFAECPQKYYMRYIQRIEKRYEDAAPLRIGTAYHRGLELQATGHDAADAIRIVRNDYKKQIYVRQEGTNLIIDDTEKAYWLLCEMATVSQLLRGRFEFIPPHEYIECEKAFEFDFYGFSIRGKPDGIITLPDGRTALLEIKTHNGKFDPLSKYFESLRIDQQLSHYYLMLMLLGINLDTIIYDVTSTSLPEPSHVPVTDENGFKIVRDEAGQRQYKKDGEPYASVPSGKGGIWKLESRLETPEEYENRLAYYINKNWHEIYVQREIPRLDSDIERYKEELQQKLWLIDYSRKLGCFPRETGACLKWGRLCPFFSLCEINNTQFEPETLDALGFQIRDSEHPELKDESNV